MNQNLWKKYELYTTYIKTTTFVEIYAAHILQYFENRELLTFTVFFITNWYEQQLYEWGHERGWDAKNSGEGCEGGLRGSLPVSAYVSQANQKTDFSTNSNLYAWQVSFSNIGYISRERYLRVCRERNNAALCVQERFLDIQSGILLEFCKNQIILWFEWSFTHFLLNVVQHLHTSRNKSVLLKNVNKQSQLNAGLIHVDANKKRIPPSWTLYR